MAKVNIDNVKSQLAKLMATENISVQHAAVHTAMFDVKNRILFLPYWKNITNELYDLLVGHEVGHALETPDAETLIRAYDEISPDRELAKGFINVVEDARIEKLIKRRYPGLRRQFVGGYKNLIEQDFFHIKGQAVEKMNLLDRINLFFKLGHVDASNIPFFDDERPFITRIENAEKFEEVVQICKDIYAFLKERNKIIQMNVVTVTEHIPGDGKEPDMQISEKSDNGKGGASGDAGETVKVEKPGDNKADGPASSDEGEDEANKNDNNESAGDHNHAGRFSAPVMSGEPKIDDMTSKTDKAFDYAKKVLANTNRYEIPAYANITHVDPEQVVVSHKEVHNVLRAWYSDQKIRQSGALENLRKEYNKFKQDNNNVISYMLREFEARKAADEYARISSARTGVLDTNKIHTYRYNDDLFRRVSIRPGSKNHGIVMFIDLSGSMSDSMAGTIEQLMVLTMFCRRAQIAFEVYGFTDNIHVGRVQKLAKMTSGQEKIGYHVPMVNAVIGDVGYNNIVLEPFALKQYLTSRMSTSEYNEAMLHLWYIRSSYTHRRYDDEGNYSSFHVEIPKEEGLSGTPLCESIIAAREVVKAFREKNNIQIVSTVFLTDGEGAPLSYKTGMENKLESIMNSNHIVLNDKKTGFQYKCKVGHGSDGGQSVALLNALRDYTGARTIGFFLATPYHVRSMLGRYGQEYDSNCRVQFDKNKFISIKAAGYDEYFMVNSRQLQIKDEELGTGKTANSMAKQFNKYLRGKAVNRVLLSRFVELIAS